VQVANACIPKQRLSRPPWSDVHSRLVLQPESREARDIVALFKCSMLGNYRHASGSTLDLDSRLAIYALTPMDCAVLIARLRAMKVAETFVQVGAAEQGGAAQ
jgi:hypothetical protein